MKLEEEEAAESSEVVEKHVKRGEKALKLEEKEETKGSETTEATLRLEEDEEEQQVERGAVQEPKGRDSVHIYGHTQLHTLAYPARQTRYGACRSSFPARRAPCRRG